MVGTGHKNVDRLLTRWTDDLLILAGRCWMCKAVDWFLLVFFLRCQEAANIQHWMAAHGLNNRGTTRQKMYYLLLLGWLAQDMHCPSSLRPSIDLL